MQSSILNQLKYTFIWLIAWVLIIYYGLVSPTTIRANNSIINDWLFIFFAVLFPITLILLSLSYQKLFRWLLISAAIISCIPIAIAVLFTLLDIRNIRIDGEDLSFKVINQLSINDSHYRLYRTNGGATTSFGLVLRKEKPLFFGLKLVSRLKGYSPASEGKIEQLNSNYARLVVAPNGRGKGEQVFKFSVK